MAMHPEYRERWVAASYHDKMGSAEVCLPPAADFIRVYHMTTAEYALAAIILRRLKVARFSDINDPFELFALNLKGSSRRQVMQDFKDEFDRRQGLLSFSGNWTSPVLWSHYANKHRGICLGFDLRRAKAQKVDYEDERLRQELDKVGGVMQLSDEQKNFLQRTKFAHWSYEEEQRLFVELENAPREGALYFRSFDDDLRLAEVILGIECHLPIAKISAAVATASPGVPTFRTRRAVKSFYVVPDEPTVP